MNSIQSRIILHFPGFEPLNAEQHRERFVRAAKQTSAAWKIAIDCHPMRRAEGLEKFQVQASGPNWNTFSEVHVFDISQHIAELNARPLLEKIFTGYAAFGKVVFWGGLWQYFRHAWRFGCFFLFPFVLMAVGLIASGWLTIAPWRLGASIWSLVVSTPVALALFVYAFMPLADRLYTSLLFSDWKCAVDLATLRNPSLNSRIEEMVNAARTALCGGADEYLIVSHSIGGQSAVHVIGILLEREPELFQNKRIIFATVGSGLLQSALLRPAKALRARVAAIAEHPSIFWFDVQCHTDTVNFYKCKIAKAAGYDGLHQPVATTIRLRTMLEKSRYDRIKRDLMRVHRQYVMGNDMRANFDFPLMCVGPMPAETFSELGVGQLAPIDEFGGFQSKKDVAGFTV